MTDRITGAHYFQPGTAVSEYAPPARPAPVVPEGIELPLTVHQVGETIMWPTRLESYGDQTTVTTGDLAELADSNGTCHLLEYIANPELQVQRFGQTMVAPGPWPEDTPRIVPGSDRWYDIRDEVVRNARAIANDAERALALGAIRRVYVQEVGTLTPSNKARLLARTYGFTDR